LAVHTVSCPARESTLDTPLEIIRVLSYVVSLLLLVGAALAMICVGLSAVGLCQGVAWIRSLRAKAKRGTYSPSVAVRGAQRGRQQRGRMAGRIRSW
jgi:hypothetical protein